MLEKSDLHHSQNGNRKQCNLAIVHYKLIKQLKLKPNHAFYIVNVGALN
jgi:hypothetical protein